MSGALFDERDHQWKLVGGDRLPLIVDRSENRRPFLGGHGARLVKAPAENGLGWLVVEQQIALRIHEEERDTEIARQLAGQDDLNGMGHAPSQSKPRAFPMVLQADRPEMMGSRRRLEAPGCARLAAVGSAA